MVSTENNQKYTNTVAAMDLGTNSNRLLIADGDGRVLFRDVRHVALGDGLAENGIFLREPMERAICSFMDFSEMLKMYQVKRYRAIATAACRMSENTAYLKEEIKKASNIDLEVISEFEEARLTLLGAKLNAPKDKKYLFVYDLGGGSTEVTLATNTEMPEILATVSIPLGARNATEIFNLRDYRLENAKKLESAVGKYLNQFLAQIKDIDYEKKTALIATSSTPLRLASLLTEQKEYDKFVSDGQVMKISDLDRLIDNILAMDFETRASHPCIGRNRASIFVSALIIFKTIYRALSCEELIASLKGAQEAIIAELGGK